MALLKCFFASKSTDINVIYYAIQGKIPCKSVIYKPIDNVINPEEVSNYPIEKLKSQLF